MVYYPRRHESLTTYVALFENYSWWKNKYRHKRGGKQTERKVKQVKRGREWGAEGAKFWMWTVCTLYCVHILLLFQFNRLSCQVSLFCLYIYPCLASPCHHFDIPTCLEHIRFGQKSPYKETPWLYESKSIELEISQTFLKPNSMHHISAKDKNNILRHWFLVLPARS
jgi:hypothetical protein